MQKMMKKHWILKLSAAVFAACIMAGSGLLTAAATESSPEEEYDFSVKEPEKLREIDFRSLSKKNLRKAYKALLESYTELYNEYYEIEEEPETVPEEAGTQEKAPVYQSTVSLNIRREPSTDSEIVGRFDTGAVVSVQEIADGWAKIAYDGGTAYVSAQYVKEADPESLPEEARPDDGTREVPGGPEDLIGAFCEDVREAFVHAGFTAVSVEAVDAAEVEAEELPFGEYTEPGDVLGVTVDGRDNFGQKERFAAEVPVVVRYLG